MNDALQTEVLKPPVTSVGVIGWVKSHLFNGIFNSLLTIATLFLLWKIVPPFVEWAFLRSNWLSSAQACRGIEGACWSVITQNIRFILFGFFPRLILDVIATSSMPFLQGTP